ncbi:MAG: hypothetical protein AAF567_17455 [Actinomycetota bacterium]
MTLIGLRAFLALLTAVALFASSCSGSEDSTAAPSGSSIGPTGYYAMDIATPEAGAVAMIDAWTARDFILAFQLFDSDAQSIIVRETFQVDLDPWVLYLHAFPDNEEHLLAPAIWAQIVWTAARTDSLIVDLAGATIEGEVGGATTADGRPATDLAARLADGRSVVLRMAQSESGRWRVNRIGLSELTGESRRVVVAVGCEADERVQVVDPASCPALDEVLGKAGAFDVLVRDVCLVMQGHPTRRYVLTSFDGDLLEIGERLAAETCPGDPSLLVDPNAPSPATQPYHASAEETYGALQLATPDEAVETFRALFVEQRFVTLLHAADREAQAKLFEFTWVSDDRAAELRESMRDLPSEHTVSSAVGLFDTVMRMGFESGDLLIDLRGDIEIDAASEPGAPVGFADRRAVLIEATSDQHPAGLGFVVVESSTGRWRVRQVASPASAVDPDGGLFAVG